MHPCHTMKFRIISVAAIRFSTEFPQKTWSLSLPSVVKHGAASNWEISGKPSKVRILEIIYTT